MRRLRRRCNLTLPPQAPGWSAGVRDEGGGAVRAQEGSIATTRGLPARRGRVLPLVLAIVAAGIALAALAATRALAPAASHSAASAQRHAAPRVALSSLPLPAQGVASAAAGADSPAYAIRDSAGGLRAHNPAQRLRAAFGTAGVAVSAGATHVQLGLRGIG